MNINNANRFKNNFYNIKMKISLLTKPKAGIDTSAYIYMSQLSPPYSISDHADYFDCHQFSLLSVRMFDLD